MSEAVPTPPVPAPRPPAPPSTASSIKDTLESILVAFILAFVFRAFVVEAFVIPTGSMAPTLLGANLRYHCDDCGYDFTVNYSGISTADDVIIPSDSRVPEVRAVTTADGRRVLVPTGRYVDKTFNIHCPNCGYKLSKAETTNNPVFYGDRILVLKYLYLFQHPHRWDVVVFKSPYDPPGTPTNQRYQQNYIKRLIGTPGEQLVILDGDVYVRRGDDEPWVVQTKTGAAQRALWRIVYDNDHHPQGLPRPDAPRWEQPWKQVAGSGWNTGGNVPTTGRTFHFDSTNGSGTLAFDASANAEQHAFTDFLAYDVTRDQQEHAPPDSYNVDAPGGSGTFVSDLKLDLFYRRESGDGALRLELTKRDRTFTAVLSPDHATLLSRTGDGPDQSIGQSVPLPRSRHPLHIDFTNVDYHVALKIDGETVLETTPKDYAPDVQQLLKESVEGPPPPAPTVHISADHQVCSLQHIGLWRDVYYLNRNPGLNWAIPYQYPDHVMRLGKDEYFVLGDNSYISADARYWTDPIKLPWEDLDVQSGRVPGRFLLGKAFFVYWPAGYRLGESGPAFIPNFGQMRFIH